MKVMAPWTKEQVKELNKFQANRKFHPFTCPNDHGHDERTLIAVCEGWKCPHCDYTQDWAHHFMMGFPDWSKN